MFIVSASSPGSTETQGLSIYAKKASLKKAALVLALTIFMIIYVPHPVSAQAPSPFSCGGEPDFSITTSPSELHITAGSSNSTTLTLTSFYGFTGTINMTALASSPYLNASLTLDSVVLPSGGSKTSTLDISANSTTPSGSYSISITASNSTLPHYTSVGILVPGPGFILTSATFFTTVARGSTATDVISVTSLNGFAGTVALDSSSSPFPVPTTLTPTSITLAAGETKNSTLDFRTNSTTVPGYYDVSVKGTSSSLSRSTAVFILVIGPGFELSATPDSLTLSIGSSGHVAINVTSLHDFSSPVSLSAFADPSIGLSFSSPVVMPPANGGAASDLTISAMPLAYVGLHTVEVVGMSGPQANFTFVSVKVTGVAADFNMTAAPDSITIMPGGASASSTITFTSIDGFADTLAVSLFCPFIGLKASISPGNVTLTPGRAATDALTVSADTNAPTGDYSIDVEGNNGTLFHSAFVFVTVATPDFAIFASPPYLSFTLPASGTSTITVASILGYSHTVSLAVTSYSPGLTVNCPTTSVTVSSTANGTSTCTFSATVPGSYTTKITGTAAPLSHSVVVFVVVTGPQPDFDISASPTTKGPLYPGAHGTGTITITPLNSFTGNVDLTATPSAGLTATLSPTSITGSGTSTLNVTAPAAGTYTVTVTGTSGSLVHTTAVITVNVVDFNITASSPSATAVGAYATSTISVVAVNGFPGTVTLVDPPPTGLTCYPFAPPSVTGSGTATLSCSSTTPGTYPVTITGTNGSLTHSTTATFTFVLVPDFAVTTSTPSSVNVGQSASSTITLTALNGFTGTVTLADSPPAGLTCGAIAPGSLTLPPSATATLSCSATTAGSYTVTVTGTSSSGSHAATATFNFEDFTINASPASVGPVIVGASGTSTITVTAQNGFSGVVSLSANPLAGLTATLGTPSVTGSGTSTLTVSATAAGTYTVTVTGTSDMLSHVTNTVTVTVTAPPPPDFSITATPPSSVNTSQSASSTITVTALNSFTGTVALSNSPLPTGLTCSPIMPNSFALPPSPATASLSCSASTAGSYTVTVKGTGGSGFHLATATFTFVTPPPPDFSISASKTSLSIQAGDTTAETITLTSLNGFTGTVSISATVSASGPQASLVPTSITLGVSRNSTLTIAVPAIVSVGTYTVTVTGTYGSLSHTATVTVSVTAASPAPPQQAASNILGLDPTVFYGVIGVVIAAVAGGIGVLMWKKRSSPASTAK